MALAHRARERLAVGLTAAVGVLSLVTGVINLTPAVWATPLARYVPEVVQTVVALTGAFTGFAMLVTAWGLSRRLTAAWWSAVVLLPVTAIQAVAQSSLLSLPLFLLSLAALPTILASRRGFDRDVSLSQVQWSGVGALAAVLIYGTGGAFLLRAEFRGLETPLDALYYTVVTASTVGYGDVTPTSPLGRAFALSVVALGIAGFGIAAAALLVPALENRIVHALGRMTRTELELLRDHLIVLGYSDLTEPILAELEGRVDVVVITEDESTASRLSDRGYDVFVADPADESILRRAQLSEAAAVVAATDSDADDALAVLTARQLDPDVRIVSAATERENVGKLERAGADAVISPATIVGHLLVEAALAGADAGEIAERVLAEELGSFEDATE